MTVGGAPSGLCNCCKVWQEYLELDHVIPRFEGGENTIENLQWLCRDCHKSKTKLESGRANRGRVASEETRKKLSVARKVRVTKPETRIKMSLARTGRPCSEETKIKIGNANRGRKRA